MPELTFEPKLGLTGRRRYRHQKVGFMRKSAVLVLQVEVRLRHTQYDDVPWAGKYYTEWRDAVVEDLSEPNDGLLA